MSSKSTMLRSVLAKKVSSPSPMSDYDFPQRITFNFKQLPAAKNWKNGKKYTLVMEVEQHSSTKESATFEIQKIGQEETDNG